MSKKIILGLTGEMLSGKGTIAEYLQENYQAKTYRFSTILRDMVDRLYVDQTRENLQNISTVLRQTFSEDILSQVIAKDVQQANAEIVCVDGIRRLKDIEMLKDLDGFYLVYVKADPQIRYARMMSRGENTGEQQKTFEEFMQDQQREADAQIQEVAQQADFIIENDGNLSELQIKTDELIKQIQRQHTELSFNNYQTQSKKTALYPNQGNNFIYPTLGLVGEAGEVAEKIKKVIRDNQGFIDEEKKIELQKELGDVLWYIAQMCTELGLSMEDVAKNNLEKLFSRLERNQIHGSGDNR